MYFFIRRENNITDKFSGVIILLIIIIRAVLLYLLIVISLRLMGKKQLAQLQPSELVTTILISNIATLSLEDSAVPMIYGILPILVIVCVDVFMSYVLLKSNRIRRLVTGTPQIIISGGVVDKQIMKHLRYSVDELMEAMRESGIFDISEVQYAIVETTGKINFYQKSCYRTATAGDINCSAPNCDPPILLIKDGEINKPALQHFGKTGKEVEAMVGKIGYRVNEIFIMTASKENGLQLIFHDGSARAVKTT